MRHVTTSPGTHTTRRLQTLLGQRRETIQQPHGTIKVNNLSLFDNAESVLWSDQRILLLDELFASQQVAILRQQFVLPFCFFLVVELCQSFLLFRRIHLVLLTQSHSSHPDKRKNVSTEQ